jgi:regulator of nucleoside diphosphate kinase
MYRERLAEMRPPIAIDANHLARLSALSSMTSGPMVEVSEYLREELDRAHVLPAEKLRPTSSISAATSNFATSKPGRFGKSSWFIPLMLILPAGACRS